MLFIIADEDCKETTYDDDEEMHNFPLDKHPDNPFLNKDSMEELKDITQVYIYFLSFKVCNCDQDKRKSFMFRIINIKF